MGAKKKDADFLILKSHTPGDWPPWLGGWFTIYWEFGKTTRERALVRAGGSGA
jgi:hypothetical protein